MESGKRDSIGISNYYTKEQVDEVFLFAGVKNGRSKTECIRLFDVERRYFF